MNGNPAGAPITVAPGRPEQPSEQAPRSQPGSEAERFEDLASKLTRVPKTELDEQRQKS